MTFFGNCGGGSKLKYDHESLTSIMAINAYIFTIGSTSKMNRCLTCACAKVIFHLRMRLGATAVKLLETIESFSKIR